MNTKGGDLILTGFFYSPFEVTINGIWVNATIQNNGTELKCPVTAGTGAGHQVIVSLGATGCIKQVNSTWSYL